MGIKHSRTLLRHLKIRRKSTNNVNSNYWMCTLNSKRALLHCVAGSLWDSPQLVETLVQGIVQMLARQQTQMH